VIIFLTVCSKNRRPILANASMHALLVKAWSLSRQWIVGRYIMMPDHVHLFCSPTDPEEENVKDWAAYWKSLISRAVLGYGPLAADGVAAVPPMAREGAVPPAPKSAVPDDSLWQRDGWDTQLRSGELYHEKWEYVRMNPVRKLLTDDPAKWPFQGELNELLW
jgi:REP element-mobilizing transposase RayT